MSGANDTVDKSWHWFTLDDGERYTFPYTSPYLGEFYHLAEPEYHTNARGGLLVTSLVAALHGKRLQVTELLHRHGTDVDVWGGGEHTPPVK